jgi:hypothetical protein
MSRKMPVACWEMKADTAGQADTLRKSAQPGVVVLQEKTIVGPNEKRTIAHGGFEASFSL